MKGKSVLYAWGLSYLVLLALMLALCGMLGYRARAQLIQEYKSITQTLQGRASGELQAYFDDMATCAYEIANNYTVYNFVADPQPQKASYYNLNHIQETLNVYEVHNDNGLQRYLYMNNIRRALSSETIYREDELYRTLFAGTELAEDDFSALLSQYHFNEIKVLQRAEGDPSVLMLSSVPLVRREARATLFQVLDPAQLESMVRASSAVEGSTTVLLDADGDVICATGDTALAGKLSSADVAQVHDSELKLDGTAYWFQYERLKAEDWSLITVLPMSEIQARSSWIVRQSVPIVIAILLAGALLCGFFLYYNYRPLARLRKHLTGPDGGFSGNEYEQLAAAFTDAKSSLEQMQELWEEQTRRLRQEFLQSCLEGDVVYDERRLRQTLEHLDAGFVGDWFCVALLGADEGAQAGQPAAWASRLRETVGKSGAVSWTELAPRGQEKTILLNGNSAEALAAALTALRQALDAGTAQGGAPLKGAFSKPWRNFENIHLAYLEASEQWQFQREQAPPLEEDRGAAAQAEVPRLSPEQEELLIRYITAGNAQEAGQTLRLILRHNLDEQQLPVSMCRCLAYDLLGGILRAVGALPAVWEAQKEALRADLHLLRHAARREELAQLLQNTVQRTAQACAECRRAAAPAKDQPVDRIMQCVHEHYRDLDFNVSKVAEYLGMNVAYLSKLFKQQTGIGLLNYINGLRVKYAKQCILQQHISVAQAAHEAGFENINTFIRIFKKYEGTTPGSISGE